MKRTFAAWIAAAGIALAGCAGTELYRGPDASGTAFISTGRPAAVIRPAEDFCAVASEHTVVRVGEEDSFFLIHPADVWYALYSGSDDRQLAVMMASCGDDREWEVRILGVEFQRLRLIRSQYAEHGGDATVHVYVRPAARDPWKPFFEKKGGIWQGDVLVARYEWTYAGNRNKLLVEYREPAKRSAEELAAHPAEADAFLARSRKAFFLAPKDEKITKGKNIPAGIIVPDDKLAPVIGSLYRADQWEL